MAKLKAKRKVAKKKQTLKTLSPKVKRKVSNQKTKMLGFPITVNLNVTFHGGEKYEGRWLLPSIRTVKFVTLNGRKITRQLAFPHTVFWTEDEGRSIFVGFSRAKLKKSVRVKSLYLPPLPNISENGQVCLGRSATKGTLDENIAGFFNSRFVESDIQHGLNIYATSLKSFRQWEKKTKAEYDGYVEYLRWITGVRWPRKIKRSGYYEDW